MVHAHTHTMAVLRAFAVFTTKTKIALKSVAARALPVTP